MKNHFVISFARKIAFVVLFLGLCVSSFAQQKISGTVVDVSKQPVIGATVMVQGGQLVQLPTLTELGLFQFLQDQLSLFLASVMLIRQWLSLMAAMFTT